jgi:hypothetical protein
MEEIKGDAAATAKMGQMVVSVLEERVTQPVYRRHSLE